MAIPPSSELTAQQRSAVQSRDAKLVVRASAGAGKTRVLVARYLRHVCDEGFSPDEILTITFTRKAAAEMKRRIVDELVAAGRIEDAQIAETGPIQTIHGFCERLLRETSADAGLDPNFEVLNEADSARFLERSVLAAMGDADADPWAAKLIERLAGRRLREESSPHARIEAALRRTVEEFRGTALTAKAAWSMHRDPDELLRMWETLRIEDLEPAVRAAFDGIADSRPFALRLHEAYKSTRTALPEGVPSTDRFAEATERDRGCAEATVGLMSMACEAWSRLESELEASNQLDFSALERKAISVLESSSEARARVRRQFRMVLVDESQDLSPGQHRLLEALGPASEMFVGDAQQSIYGFRQADVRLFLQKTLSGNAVVLSENHRSAPGIIRFVDGVFRRKWKDDYVPMSDSPFDFDASPEEIDGVEIWEQKTKDTRQAAQWVADVVQERKSAGDVAVLVRRASYGAGLASMVETLGVHARIVGGSERFYARLEVRDLANVLAALSDSTDLFALAATLHSPLAGLSLDAVVLLTAAGATPEAFENVSRRLPEDEPRIARFRSWFEPLSAYADRLPAFDVLAKVFSSSPYLENLARRPRSRQALANVYKLLRLAGERPNLGPKEYAEFLRAIRELKHREGDAPLADVGTDAVTIMTIHKAKGLEFPVVILPDMHGTPVRNMQDVEIDKWLGLVTTKFEMEAGMFHHWICRRRKDRELEEVWRVLYVGMTRAKERLCVVMHPDARSCLAQQLANLIGYRGTAPPGVRVRRPEPQPAGR